MPYGQLSEIPQRIRDTYSEEKQRIWLAVFNDTFAETQDEGRAFATANAAVTKAESYKLPQAARNNAQQVLDWREEHGDEVKGMTEVGWRRARQLAENESVGIEAVRAMSAFNRHRDNGKLDAEHKDEPWKDAGYVAWLGWGGTTGIDWARGITGAAEKRLTKRLTKRALSDDVFTEPMEAVARAMDLGLGPAAHPYETANGEIVYMPGATHDHYRAARGIPMEVDEEEEPEIVETPDELERAIRAIIETVRKHNDEANEGRILKIDDEERIVYGWASVSTLNGELVTDKQGDQIEPTQMEKAATRFMESARMAKAMHEGGKIGEVVHSFPLTKQLQERLGVYSSIEGWLVGMKIHDDAVWKRVKSGELRAFSIGGKGKRVAL